MVLPTFGCTLWPASATVRPWLTTWSTIVALISSGVCPYNWPLLPLPLFCSLPLPPRILTPLPWRWPSISVSQYCRNGTHYVLLGSYMFAKWRFVEFSFEWLWRSGLSLVTINTSHTPPHQWKLRFTWEKLFNLGDIFRKKDKEMYKICLTDFDN